MSLKSAIRQPAAERQEILDRLNRAIDTGDVVAAQVASSVLRSLDLATGREQANQPDDRSAENTERTSIRMRAQVETIIGKTFSVRMFDEIFSVTQSDPDHLLVRVKTVKALEQTRGWLIKKSGLTVVSYTRSNGYWTETSRETFWKDAPEIPTFVSENGKYLDGLVF